MYNTMIMLRKREREKERGEGEKGKEGTSLACKTPETSKARSARFERQTQIHLILLLQTV